MSYASSYENISHETNNIYHVPLSTGSKYHGMASGYAKYEELDRDTRAEIKRRHDDRMLYGRRPGGRRIQSREYEEERRRRARYYADLEAKNAYLEAGAGCTILESKPWWRQNH